jgi:putative tryptophan/tyrosine transport system substrate-binding protein
MHRRELIVGLGAAAAAWPLAAKSQQPERMRRIGMLTGTAGDDAQTTERTTAFLQELQKFGWTVGRNLQIDLRAGAGSAVTTRKYAAELVALQPDIILATGTISVNLLLEFTRTIPIVFTVVVDPVGAGFIEKLSRPGGNVTGFMMFDYSLASKWPELLKQVAPNVTQAAVLRDPSLSVGIGQFAVIQAAAPSLGLEISAISVSDPKEIERAVAAFAGEPNGGLIVTAGPSTQVHRDLILTLAARHRLPAVYYNRARVAGAELITYGANITDEFREAARYIDRILRGEKPTSMPVQAPNKYELVINIKTAKVLGITVPPSVLARADEVIE